MEVIEDTTPRAYPRVIDTLDSGQESRYGDTKEEHMVIVRSDNPRERIMFREGINLAFGLQECFAYWNGLNPGYVQRYNEKMKEFMYDGELHGSAYGRYFRRLPHDQIARVLQQFEDNMHTRRAIINVHNAYVEDYDKGDVACTIYLHPIIRDGELHMTANMRSQDMLWGYPYDVHAFQWIQEALAGILDVDLGTYTHVMNSCHYYTEKEDEVIQSAKDCEWDEYPDCRLSINELNSVMDRMHMSLDRARGGQVPHHLVELVDEKSTFYADWLRTMIAYEQARFHDGDASIANEITTSPFREYLSRVL